MLKALVFPRLAKASKANLRDCEYTRHGSSALLAAIDLLTGKAFPLESDTHKSARLYRFPEDSRRLLPEGDITRLILDNHIVHKSKETKAYIATRPGRFQFVFTPKLKSLRLNFIDELFRQDDAPACLSHARLQAGRQIPAGHSRQVDERSWH